MSVGRLFVTGGEYDPVRQELITHMLAPTLTQKDKRLNLIFDNYKDKSRDLLVTYDYYEEYRTMCLEYQKKLLTRDEMDLLIDSLQKCVEGTLDQAWTLTFKDPSIVFFFNNMDNSDSLLGIAVLDRQSSRYYSITIDVKQAEWFYCYLLFITGRKTYRDKEFMERIRRTHLEYGYRWSLVGNIIDEHLAGEDRKLVHGTNTSLREQKYMWLRRSGETAGKM